MAGIFSDVLHQYKLFHVIQHWGRITLNSVLEWSLDFQMKNKANLYEIVIEKKCKNSFQRDQIKILKEGVTIESLDVSLTFLLLLHISGLSHYKDEAWQNSSTLEYKLRMVKNQRNNLCHSSDSVTEKDTIDRIHEQRKLYVDILNEAGTRFSVGQDIIKNKIEEITNGVDAIHEKVRETFDPNNKQHVQNFHKELKQLNGEIKREIIQEAQVKLQEVNSRSFQLQLVSWTPVHYSAKPSELYVSNGYQLIEQSNSSKGKIVKDIIDIKINEDCKQQFFIVCGERGSGKTMLCKYLIEKSTNTDTSSWICKYSFILYCAEVDYKYDSINAMVRNIFQEIYNSNGLSFGEFLDIVTSVPVLVVIDGYTESHIKLIRDIASGGNISAMITTRPGSHVEVKNLLNYTTKIMDVHIQMVKNETLEKIAFNGLTILGDTNQFSKLIVKIKDVQEQMGTWLKYPLGIILMTVLWIHKEIDSATSTYALQMLFFKHMANRFKDGVYKFNLCTTMDVANEKCSKIIKNCEEMYMKSEGVELKKQALEQLKSICKESGLPEEYTLSSFLDSEIKILGLEAFKVRKLPCSLKYLIRLKLPCLRQSQKQTGSVKLINNMTNERTINNILKVVFENNNDKVVAAAAAARIDTKNCRIKEGYLEALPVVLEFTNPTEVIFEIEKHPNTVEHLLPCIKYVSERSTTSRIYLRFEYNYYHTNNGISNEYLELLAQNQSCRLLLFMGSLKLSGLSLLPKWLERLYLRITDNQISTLNGNLPRLQNLNKLALVLDLYNSRPELETIDRIQCSNGKVDLHLQIAADVTDEEAIYASKVLVKLCPRGVTILKEIQLKGTHLTSIGIRRCMDEIHKNSIATQNLILYTSEIITDGEEGSLRSEFDRYNMKFLCKSWKVSVGSSMINLD